MPTRDSRTGPKFTAQCERAVVSAPDFSSAPPRQTTGCTGATAQDALLTCQQCEPALPTAQCCSISSNAPLALVVLHAHIPSPSKNLGRQQTHLAARSQRPHRQQRSRRARRFLLGLTPGVAPSKHVKLRSQHAFLRRHWACSCRQLTASSRRNRIRFMAAACCSR
eukprot:SAG31_NODE_1927_length_6884_cov_2.706264_3_plen_166_part_00